MIAGIVASFSRGGFLGLVCAIGVLMWRLARHNRALFLAIALVLCAGFIALAPSDYRTRLATTGDGSSVQRQSDLKRSLLVLIHHPLLGVGMNNYVLFSNTEHATHNAYTQIGSEMGVPAMVVYIMFLLAAIKPLRRIGLDVSEAGRKSRLRYLAAGIEASLVGYMVASFFSSVAYLWYLYYLVGYAICLRRLYEASQSPQANARAEQNDNRVGVEPRSSSQIGQKSRVES
jgi:O-antigen ligase